MHCLFCSIVDGSSASNIVYDDDHCVAFMDILPMTPGHCLVIPKRHVRDIFELSDDDAAHVMQACRSVSNIVHDRLEPLGINLVNNNGAAADQSQFHFHIHLIPRYGRDRLLHPWERSYGNPDQIRSIAEILRGEREIPRPE
ncbi:MAG: HIT domain-containing protein [Acidimicrobiales bacterium]|nr:HIT domain-containing protein [Acidimicrobiales bacterium]